MHRSHTKKTFGNLPDEWIPYEHDARAVIRLLGKLAVIKGDHQAKKRFLFVRRLGRDR